MTVKLSLRRLLPILRSQSQQTNKGYTMYFRSNSQSMHVGEFKASLTQAFKALRKEGYWARQNWKCCQACGCAAVPEEKSGRAVFYHAQDARHLRGDEPEVMLTWSGDGQKIVDILKEFVKVDWDGSANRRILCSPKY